ncbi:uncharacterized protein C8R40DRAFT_1167825 [Lentinula edodes]|uniref:uncharacterized protein n=1 Tax=Lentinula edodes TaxID=5353 RepID=UPI001E8E5E70|nr:uncharacterized protein C8R40DRAFT_1167825 [Lentinula edodes]KAH7878384.1 hypothetical protein C8R40DRAFT_1167825 [Lentinula edodes]
MNATQGPSIQDLFLKINRFHVALERSPLDSRTMKAAVDVWPSINLLLENSKIYDAGAHILHYTIMLSHYRLYTWVSESIEHVLDHPSSHWWYRLIKTVGEVVESGNRGMFYFNSSDFLPTIEPPRTYLWNFHGRQHDQRSANSLLSSRIIFHWLGLPIESDDKHNVQSLFLKSLMDSSATASILLLDEVWLHIALLVTSVALTQNEGRHRSLEIQQLIDLLQAAHRRIMGLPTSLNSPSSAIFAESPSTPPLLPPHTTSNDNISYRISPIASLTSVRENNRVIFFRDWLLEIAEAYMQFPPLSMDQLKLEQRRILENSDSSCPFRELASSRKQVSGPNGLFAHHSREGTFSALLFRGVLFNTEALQETGHTGFFESLEAWSQFKALYADRGENLYATLVHTVQPEDGLPLTIIWQFIVHAKNDKKNKLFPSFGDLSAYLLTVDLTYAHRIPWPSLDEVAHAIYVLAKGALHGLQKMDLVPTDTYSEIRSKRVLKALYRFLDEDAKFQKVKQTVYI